jgi:hypothetical protein
LTPRLAARVGPLGSLPPRPSPEADHATARLAIFLWSGRDHDRDGTLTGRSAVDDDERDAKLDGAMATRER